MSVLSTGNLANTRTLLRYVAILGVSAVSSALLGGCCCPMNRQVVRSPEVDVEVIDEQTGEPVAGARVRLCRVRIGPPPSAVVDRWEAKTDAEGRASFGYLEGSETMMPLMPHGVAQRGWELCADDDSHGVGKAGDGQYVLVESGPADKTPHRVPDQTIALAASETSKVVCPCDTLPDETAGGARPKRSEQ